MFNTEASRKTLPSHRPLCYDHPWRYVKSDEPNMLDTRWCPMCGREEYTDDGNEWFT